jgi:serine protease Do
MKNVLIASLIILSCNSGVAEEKLWSEGSEHPQDRVNVDLKAMSPKAYLNVSEKMNESVVNISTTQTTKTQPFGFPGQDLGPFGQEFFERFFGGQVPNAPRAQKQSSLGSGFILNKDGYIITNNHVVAQADEIQITFYDETEVPAKLIGRDSKTDVALLKVEKMPTKAIPVLIGDSDAMKVGEIVIAIGNPFGLTHSVTQGIISAKERAIGIGPYDDFIQTDASINPGNSGGPLLNLYGEVIGINTAIAAQGQGIGFAIPINSAKEVIRKLQKDGKVVRGQLGVQIQKITDDHVKALKLKDRQGALISSVLEDSPAAEAGIKAGDVIVSFDEKKIRDWHQLPIFVSNTPIGKRVKVELVRNSTLKTVMLLVGEQKEDEKEKGDQVAPAPDKKDTLGVTVDNLSKEVIQSLGLNPKQKGVLVLNVDPDSLAFTKGVRRGDVIVEVNRKNISGPKDYLEATQNLKKGDSILLLIVRRQGTQFIAYEL